MDMIWMQHPQLPEDQLIYEPEESRIGLELCGWRVTDPPPPMELLGPLDLEGTEPESGAEPEPGAKYAAAVESRPENQSAQDGKEK